MSLVSVEHASRIVGMPDFPGIGRMMGDKVENETLPFNRIGQAINVVVGHMMEKVAFTGSVVSRAKEGAPTVKSRELEALQQFVGKEIYTYGDHIDYQKTTDDMPQTVKLAYHESAYDLQRMPKMSYFMLKLMLSFGQNIDIHGYHKSGNFDGAHGKLMTLLALANHKLINGKAAIFSELEYYKRFKMWHLEMAGDTTGGFNFMDFDTNFDDKRAKMLSYQAEDQYGKLGWDEHGIAIEIGEGKLNKKMSMVGHPKDLGDWLMHSVRAIRTMVMEGEFDLQNIDIQSFLNKLPAKKSIGFEETVAIVSNMIVAHKQNPELTEMFMDKLQLNQYFKGILHRKNHNIIDRKLYNYLNIDNEKWDTEKLSRQIEKAEYDLIGGTTQFIDRTSEDEFRFQDFLPLIIQFLPIGLDELEQMIPEPFDRETIRPVMAGAKATSMTRNNEKALVWDSSYGQEGQWVKKMYIDAAMVFEEMYALGIKEKWEMNELMLISEARDYLLENAPLEIGDHDIKVAEYLRYSASLRYNRKTKQSEVPIGWKKKGKWLIPLFQEATIQ